VSHSFIYKKKKSLSNNECFNLIKAFEADREFSGPGMVGGEQGTHENPEIKKSTDISFNPAFETHPIWGPILNPVITAVAKGMADYERYNWMAMDCLAAIQMNPIFNMQRFYPGEAYHQMHCERGSTQFPYRTHAWMIYLNDIKEGGQTEFPLQNLLEIPELGKLLIWPADFTHIHRGLVAPNETKYLLTGWLSFVDDTKEIKEMKPFDWENDWDGDKEAFYPEKRPEKNEKGYKISSEFNKH